MPPELWEALKYIIGPVFTGTGGLLLGRAERKARVKALEQQSKDSEFARLKIAMDELQEQNSLYARKLDAQEERYRQDINDLRQEMSNMRVDHTSELRSMRDQHNLEKSNLHVQIERLTGEVFTLRTENSELKIKLAVIETENARLKEELRPAGRRKQTSELKEITNDPARVGTISPAGSHSSDSPSPNP